MVVAPWLGRLSLRRHLCPPHPGRGHVVKPPSRSQWRERQKRMLFFGSFAAEYERREGWHAFISHSHVSSWRQRVHVLLWFLIEPSKEEGSFFLSWATGQWGVLTDKVLRVSEFTREMVCFLLPEPVVALSKTPCILISGSFLDQGTGNEIKDLFSKEYALNGFLKIAIVPPLFYIWKGNRGWLVKLRGVGWKGLGLHPPPLCLYLVMQGKDLSFEVTDKGD